MKVVCILSCIAFASGFYIDNNETHEEKIVGGDYVRIADVPYQASLFWMRVQNLCGATIIHESWVVTAAHCVHNKQHISVRTGCTYRHTLVKIHRVGEIIQHDDFEAIRKDNDIALIKLVVPISFNNEQQSIELAKPQDIPREGEWMRISGFGKIGHNLEYSNDLKAAYVPVVNQENCQISYRSLYPLSDNLFCAGNGDTDACKGDSGGPGVIHGKLYGIISSGEECGSTIFPGLYTRVYKYHGWIEEKTGHRF